MIALAHALALDVTAEGIETADHLHRVSALGCDLAQGYYFSRPLPPAQIQELLQAGLPHLDEAGPRMRAIA